MTRARLRLGLTQAQLAARLEIGPRSLGRWETRGAPPRSVLELVETGRTRDADGWHWRQPMAVGVLTAALAESLDALLSAPDAAEHLRRMACCGCLYGCDTCAPDWGAWQAGGAR